MSIRIALAGNPNCGKTTLFNALTGSNQFVGNWPGVTVEKKEGKYKKQADILITDLPGIYSLSPYTLEEVITRKYLLEEHPDVILNLVDGTNLERNLYLTTQLMELGIPVVVAVNMMDVVRKNGDRIDTAALERQLGCRVVEISALKGSGVAEAVSAAVDAVTASQIPPVHAFSDIIERALNSIKDIAARDLPEGQQRWYSIKLFERDVKMQEQLQPPLSPEMLAQVEAQITAVEQALDDDAESIITNQRYTYISSLVKVCHKKKNAGRLSVSDKIDRVVTNRFAALPIFAVVMFVVYYLSVTTMGSIFTDWVNDGVFGDGWHLFGIGDAAYSDAMDDYAATHLFTAELTERIDAASAAGVVGAKNLQDAIADGSFADFDEAYGLYADALAEAGFDLSDIYEAAVGEGAEDVPETSAYGVWIPGIPALVEQWLRVNSDHPLCPTWLSSLLLDGVIGGVGAVLGFVPQILILFLLLAFLEACGYMARIAFVMDRIFRKFGLSGKSFIPMLVGTGCGVPGIMASRTIESQRDRRMTIMTTTFIPCGAKLPIIALIAAALFSDAWWVAPSAYFIGIAAVILSGIMLKKTKMFAGDPAPFVMELPAYHWPTVGNLLRSMWERGWSFIRKAGTIILLSSIIIWAGSVFGVVNGALTFSVDMELEHSLLGYLGRALCWIFKPLGFGNIKATVATIMGLVAKEEVVGVFGVLDFEGMSRLAAYAFLVFNLLCAPCFAAIGAIRREMNSAAWTWLAIGYQCLFAYATSLIIYQVGSLFAGTPHAVGLIASALILLLAVFMLVRPAKKTSLQTLRAERS